MNAKIINGRLHIAGSSDDGKRLFIEADTNDGWQDLRIEVDTDDCDSKYAKAWADRLIQCVNSCCGVVDTSGVSE